MLAFLIYTMIMWFAGNCILTLFFQMIQPDEALDLLLGWQKMLARLYQGNTRRQLLGKALGDCARCTAFWFMPMWFVVYAVLAGPITGVWITDACTTTAGKIVVNVVWYCVFHSVGAFTGVWGLLKVKKDGV